MKTKLEKISDYKLIQNYRDTSADVYMEFHRDIDELQSNNNSYLIYSVEFKVTLYVKSIL